MVRRSTRIKPTADDLSENANPMPDQTSAQPNRRTADLPKGVLRPHQDKLAKQSFQQITQAHANRALRLMPKEFEAVIGIRRLQLEIDASAIRQRELARLEVEDPVAYYYAQTPTERPLYALQAAGVLFQMSGGDVAEPVAALTLMKMEMDARELAKKKARAILLGTLRAAKVRNKADEATEIAKEVDGKGKGKKRRLSAEEDDNVEPPKKKSVRFGGNE